MARTALTGDPDSYGREKLPEMRRRWAGEPGAWVRRLAPQVWPGPPPEALLGLSANGGVTERYCEGFCALGMFQTPEATWRTQAGSARVRALLGRAAAGPDGFATDVPAQVAIGLLDYRGNFDALNRRLPAGLRATTPASTWAVGLGAMAYVLGSGGAYAAIAPALTDSLGRVPEGQRLGALGVALWRAGFPGRAEYVTVRALQRLECGRRLALANGGDAAWFDLGLDPGVRAGLYASASGAQYGGAFAQAPAASEVGAGLGGLLALALFGTGAYLARDDLRALWRRARG